MDEQVDGVLDAVESRSNRTLRRTRARQTADRPNWTQHPQVETCERFFNGHERDKETGLDYMLARYYSTSIARFVSPDPSTRSVDRRLPQSWNRYTYVLNNPTRLIDPTGYAPTLPETWSYLQSKGLVQGGFSGRVSLNLNIHDSSQYTRVATNDAGAAMMGGPFLIGTPDNVPEHVQANMQAVATLRASKVSDMLAANSALSGATAQKVATVEVLKSAGSFGTDMTSCATSALMQSAINSGVSGDQAMEVINSTTDQTGVSVEEMSPEAVAEASDQTGDPLYGKVSEGDTVYEVTDSKGAKSYELQPKQ